MALAGSWTLLVLVGLATSSASFSDSAVRANVGPGVASPFSSAQYFSLMLSTHPSMSSISLTFFMR